ncbi:class I SAM-dependent methyltransferase [Paraclostridium bifermentans]|uniref:Class I SAM-dependent methyltransferase n=1 Tax=Paraclostridium bifermentans TaxID=1490 RepID=A0A5P3XED1_PARBF|nr:class I SAM-dependent methyltransferase [Paraclostridium bifermentans]QEZ67481.1 class I SAM-dependent methyltransferase [Paraclostridium bifermentans]
MKYLCAKNNLLSCTLSSIKSCSKLLDIGCGIKPFTNIECTIHICCEPYKEYIEVLNEKYKDLLVLNMSWQDVVKNFPCNSVDTILIIDVIEHLEKEEALDLLSKTLDIASEQVVIFTPLGFFEQDHPDGIDAWGLHGGKWQTHRSGWYPEDFPENPNGHWDFYICNDFHHLNNKEELLPEPKGAFWAIWSLDK